MKGCSDLQHLESISFVKCEQVNLVHSEMMKEALLCFKTPLKVMVIRRTYSVDDLYCHYMVTNCRQFTNLRVLDLSFNQIELRGLLMLLSPYSAFARNLQRLSVVGNLIVGSLAAIIR